MIQHRFQVAWSRTYALLIVFFSHGVTILVLYYWDLSGNLQLKQDVPLPECEGVQATDEIPQTHTL